MPEMADAPCSVHIQCNEDSEWIFLFIKQKNKNVFNNNASFVFEH